MAKNDDLLNQSPRLAEIDKRLGEIRTERQEVGKASKDDSGSGSRLGRGLVSGAAQAVAGIPQALAIAQGFADDTPLNERALFKAGESIQKFVDEDVLELTPEDQNSFATQVGKGLGQVASMAVPGAALGKAGSVGRTLGHATGITAGVGMAGNEGAQDYISTRKQQGKEIVAKELDDVAFANSLRGVLEYVTPFKGIKALEGVSPNVINTLKHKSGLRTVQRGKGRARVAQLAQEGLKGLTREAAQEAFDQLALNAIAKNYVKYDEERGLFKDVRESAEVGGTVGAIFNTIMGALGIRARGRFEQAIQEQIDSDVSNARQETQRVAINPETNEEFSTKEISKVAQRLQTFSHLQEEAIQRGANEDVINKYGERISELIQGLERKYIRDNVDAEEGAKNPVGFTEARALLDQYEGPGYAEEKITAARKTAKDEATKEKAIKDTESKLSDEEITKVTPDSLKREGEKLREDGVDRAVEEEGGQLSLFSQDDTPTKVFLDWMRENELDPIAVEELRKSEKESDSYKTFLDIEDAFLNGDPFSKEEILPSAVEAASTPDRVQEIQRLVESGADMDVVSAAVKDLQELIESERNRLSQDELPLEVTNEEEATVSQIDDTPVNQLPQEQEKETVQDAETQNALEPRGTPPSDGLVVANKDKDGNIYYGTPGELHFNLSNRYPHSERGDWEAVGFAGPDGKFLTREEALSQVDVNSSIDGELDAKDYREQIIEQRDGSHLTAQKKPNIIIGDGKPSESLNERVEQIQSTIHDVASKSTEKPDTRAQANEIAKDLQEADQANDVSPHEVGTTTPVSKVETVSKDIVKTTPEHVDHTDLVQLSNQIEEIDTELDMLDYVISESEDLGEPATYEKARTRVLKKEKAALQKQRKRLAENPDDLGISKEEIDEINSDESQKSSPFDGNEDVVDTTTAPEGPRKGASIDGLRRTFKDLSSRINKFHSDVEFIFYEGPESIPESLSDQIGHTVDYHRLINNDNWKGYHFTYKVGGKKQTFVIMNPSKFATHREFQKTFLHETVGHYGMSKIFGSKWDSFLDKIINTNPFIRNQAYLLHKKWKNYDVTPDKNSDNNYEFVHKSTGENIVINKKAMRKFVDEYIAEKAKLMLSSATRKELSKGEQSRFKKIVTYVRHLIRSIVGDYSKEVTDGDIMNLLSSSYDLIFKGDDSVYKDAQEYLASGRYDISEVMESAESRDKLAKSTSQLIDKSGTRDRISKAQLMRHIDTSDFTITEKEAITRIISNEFNGQKVLPLDSVTELLTNIQQIKDLEGLFDVASPLDATRDVLREGNFGRINDSWWSRKVDRFMRQLRYNKVISFFSPMGNMPNERNYDSINASAKGKISLSDDLVRRLKREFDRVKVPATKHAIYEYFTTKDADVTSIPGVSPKMQQLLQKSKETIESLGQDLVDLGYLNKEVYEENKGMYLPARYLKYIDTYAGGGKRPSFLNYLKKRNQDITPADKVALGRIEDPEFLVVESLSTMARDVALLNMFKVLNKQSEDNKYFWVLNDDARVEVDNRSINLVDAQDYINHYEHLISDGVGGVHNFTQEEHDSLIGLRDRMEQVRKAGEDAFRESVIEAMTSRGANPDEITGEVFKTFLNQHYVKMPNDYVYGALRGRYVRREIYQDLTDTFEANQVNKNSTFSRWFSPGGHIETANHFWKFMKVPANIPSWFRNFIGNAVLLDISTGTNSAKLGKMVADTMKVMMEGDPHEFNRGSNFRKESDTYRYVRWAMKNGLFGTTFSTQELYLVQEQYQKKYKRLMARKAMEDNKLNFLQGNMRRSWWWTQDNFYYMAELANHGYGMLEGIFKTVKLQDYMNQWEIENSRKMEELNDEEFHAVLFEAVNSSNDAIFDYSKIPNFLRMMRRYPLGAPFLTFTYKALPATIKGFAYRPQKFVKYAMMPYLMSQMFMAMNDLDDDDLEEIKRKMPTWTKDKMSVYLLPWKDANGNWQAMDFGYFFPWEIFQNYGLHVKNHFDTTRPGMSAIQMASRIPKELGFASGPLPSTLSAWFTNTDDFTGREIITTGAPQSQQLNELMGYLHTLWAPTWMGSQGALGRVMDEFGIEKTPMNSGRQLDKYGNDRSTLGQAAGRFVGANIYSVDPEVSHRSNIAGFQSKLRKLKAARSKTLRDRNIDKEGKARLLREHNEQIRRLRQKQQEYIRGE